MRVMLADGTVHKVSREHEPELFRSVIGGYGLFGVVLDVELELVESETYRLRSRVIDSVDFPAVYQSDVAGNDNVRLAYTHLSTAPDNLRWRRAPRGGSPGSSSTSPGSVGPARS
jgi:FAD/FMN-containing dehydrogenase